MKDLGRTEAEMYPSMEVDKKKNRKVYPTINLPISLLPKDADLDDEITIKLKGKITRIEKSKWSKDFTIEVKEGEVL